MNQWALIIYKLAEKACHLQTYGIKKIKKMEEYV